MNTENLELHLEILQYNLYIITFLITTILLGTIVISIVMINHCSKYQNENRTMWITAMLIGFPLMSIVYLFFKDKEKTEESLIEEKLREIKTRSKYSNY